jgi:DNA mismatch repair protein MSH6
VHIKKLQYWGTGRNRYQVEFPETLDKQLGAEWVFKSQKAGFKRYRNARLEEMLSELTLAEERVDAAHDTLISAIFAQFDKRFVECLHLPNLHVRTQ